VQFFKFAWVEAPALLLLRLLGLRVVFTAHNALPHVRKSWHRAFYRTWYGLIDGVHVLSAPVARDIREDLGARPRVLRQIGHGPYETLRRRFGPGMERGAARARLGVPAQAFVVLQYGLFRGYKGVDVLLSALCAMPRDAQVHLLLAGGGYPGDLARFKAIAEQADRLGDVTWLERFVTDQELCDCIAAADLVAFPYRWVSQSGALYLALTFGKPCIASDLPGFRDSLPDQQDCCFEVGNAAVLAQRILDLKDDPARLQRLQDCIAAKSRVGFDWDVIARETAALYVQVRT
jgi:glycosyltransferase involved in cell wall biosynthesis